jgi:hypothetical protein
MDLAEEVERRLAEIFNIVERIEEERWEEMDRAGELHGSASVGLDSVAASVATAPSASTTSNPTEKLVKSPQNNQPPGVMNHGATT